MGKKYRATAAGKLINLHPSTIRRWSNEGRIPHTLSPAGQRLYDEADLHALAGTPEPKPEHATVFYLRASEGEQKKLDEQYKQLTATHGQPAHTYKDKASGLNEHRRGLQQLLNDAAKHKFTHVAITQKDRLTRFGYTYLEQLLAQHGITLLVLSEASAKSPTEELLQDFMSLVASFSGKYYRLRGHEAKKRFLTRAEAELGAEAR